MKHSHQNTINTIVNLIKLHNYSYTQFVEICNAVRKKLGLKRPNRKPNLPRLPSADETRKILETIPLFPAKKMILFQLLFYTGVRVSELVVLKKQDIDLGGATIFIAQGKGGKDRIVPIPKSLSPTLRVYLENKAPEDYLFDNPNSQNGQHYSTRYVRILCKQLQIKAGVDTHLRPHLFRHQLLTLLANQGMTLEQIGLIAGHVRPETTKRYTQLSLAPVKAQYEEIIKKI